MQGCCKVLVAFALFGLLAAQAAPPRIFAVEPDGAVLNTAKVTVCPLRIITGEHFDAPGLEVWTWQPPEPDDEGRLIQRLTADEPRPAASGEKGRDREEEERLEQAFAAIARGEEPPSDEMPSTDRLPGAADPNLLPAVPPSGLLPVPARKAEPVLVRDDSMIVSVEGAAVVWVRNADGWSAPYLVGVAKPFWISDRAVRAGDYFHLFGHGVAMEYGKGKLAFRGKEKTEVVRTYGCSRESFWYTDRFLEYARVPSTLPPGAYEVFVHNTCGGMYGWAFAGTIEVTPKAQVPRPAVSVLACGAVGDGITDDTEALTRAFAESAKSGAEVHLPAGVYRVTRTLVVPDGVTLRGNHAVQSVLRGAGADGGRGAAPTPLVRLGSRSGLLRVTLDVAGAGQGGAGGAILELAPGADGVQVIECTISASGPAPLDRLAIQTEACQYVRVAGCEILGTVRIREADHVEILKNRVRGGLELAGVNSLVDANVFEEATGRVRLHPLSHSLVRYNEFHPADAAAGGAAPPETDRRAAPERLAGRTLGTATGGGEATLEDTAQRWPADGLRHSVVLILAGTGFGQYRLVAANTADTLTVDRRWTVPPDRTSRYLVGPLSMGNAFNYNYNDCGEPWEIVDSIGCAIQYHRVIGGAVVFGGSDRTPGFFPCWFNRISASWLNQTGVSLRAEAHEDVGRTVPLVFGNTVAGNTIQHPDVGHGVHVGGGGGPTPHTIDLNVIAGNLVLGLNFGVVVSADAARTLVSGNSFRFVTTPLIDRGVGTLNRGNGFFDEVVEEPLTDVLNMSFSRWRPTTLEWTSPWTGQPIPGRPLGLPPRTCGASD